MKKLRGTVGPLFSFRQLLKNKKMKKNEGKWQILALFK